MTGDNDDRASLLALEGLLVALILLGAVYLAASTAAPPSATAKPRDALRTAALDALVVLDGLQGPDGPLLHTFLTEAWHCAYDAVPSTTACHQRRPSNLSHRLESYLPPGAAYSIAFDNGADAREVYSLSTPAGERISVTHAITPDWRLTFVSNDFSCYDSTMSVNATLIPLWHADRPRTTWVNATSGTGTELTSVATGTPGVWNVTFPSNTRAASGTITANVTAARGPYPGAAPYAQCSLGSSGWLLRNILNASTYTATNATGGDLVKLGSKLELAWDLAVLPVQIPTAVLTNLEAVVYEPVPPREDAPGSYVIGKRIPLPSTWAGTSSWRVIPDSLYGIHPVVLEATLDVPGASGTVQVTLRMTQSFTVALPSGHAPIDPPYRVVLETWFQDWR